MDYDVIIIGAGASGLMAAIAAARKGSNVLVIEQKDRAGKKISATGNGKCNYTNLIQLPACYRGEDSAFAMKVLSHFDVQETIRFFEKLGIVPRERDGYLYPNSEQAASVVQVLLMECRRLGVIFAYEEKAEKVIPMGGFPEGKNNKQVYEVKTKAISEQAKDNTYRAGSLILAAGGCASPKLGSDGSGYQLAVSLGHTLIQPLPALVQLQSDEKYCKTLSGVRTTGNITVLVEGTVVAREEGELVFTDYGISGIPVLQVSRFAAKALDKKDKVSLAIDFLPQDNVETVISMLMERITGSKDKTLEQMMVGLFNDKLSFIMIKQAKLDPEMDCSRMTEQEIRRLSLLTKKFRMSITDTNHFENAQVCAGGVPAAELDETTLESKVKNGLYITGELVDVDGTCGGYNLQWAWSTGYLAGSAAGGRNKGSNL